MSFNIFAGGSNHFHYKQDRCIDGSEFELMKILAILQTMEPTKTSAVGGYIDYEAPGITDLMIALATMEILHNLNTVVSLLAMNPRSSEGFISINATETHLFGSDTVRLATYRFSPGNSPGSEFVSSIGKTLEQTDLNSFGVLLQLSIALTKFNNHIDDSITPAILISLTN